VTSIKLVCLQICISHVSFRAFAAVVRTEETKTGCQKVDPTAAEFEQRQTLFDASRVKVQERKLMQKLFSLKSN
jgi:hypothetical protein